VVASAAGVLPGESATFAVGNAPPVAQDDSFSAYEDTPLPPTTDALANDTDADGDSLTGSLTSDPVHGANGATYVPAADYNGQDSLTYGV
jgi:large repetitive protein